MAQTHPHQISALYALNSRILDPQLKFPVRLPRDMYATTNSTSGCSDGVPDILESPMTSIDTSTTPPCGTCKRLLGPRIDKQKSTGKFWRNCKSCRDRQTASKRKAKGLSLMGPLALKRKRTMLKECNVGESNSGRSASQYRRKLCPTDELLRKIEEDERRERMAKAEEKQAGLPNITPGDYTRPEQPNKANEITTTSVKEVDQDQIHANDDQEPETKDRECAVCTESFPVPDYPSLIACSHEPNVCQRCFLEWLNDRMASTTWEKILCPMSECTSSISHDDIKTYAPADVFTRFDELSMRSVLSNDPDFLYCPASGCTSGQIHDTSSAANIFRCNACGFRVCTHHTPHVPFHNDETCTQYDERVAKERAQREEEQRRRHEESASTAEVGRSSVECPGCGANISKTAGCDHMTCRRTGCFFQFCYLCRAPYEGDAGILRIGNAAHKGDCMYHSARLPSFQGPVPIQLETGDLMALLD